MNKIILSLILTSSLLPAAEVFADSPQPTATCMPAPKLKHTKQKVEHPVVLAQRATRSLGYGNRQWNCLYALWNRESHFNPKAHNKRSGAYGIAQFMPQTWKNYKVTKTSDPKLQIKYGLRYIERRYGSPCNAWKHWKTKGWY